jgi:glycosyltransferase involved in cell wall biosynthesis
MHICFITSEYPKKGFPHGGVGSFIATISKALVQENIKVSIVGMNYENSYEDELENGVTIFRLRPFKINGLTWLFNSNAINNKIRQIHKESPIDIVESAELGLAFIDKIKNIQYVIRLHGGHHFFAEVENRGINKWKGFQEKRSFQKADAFIAISSYVKNHTEKYLSYHNKQIVEINNPVNTGLFQPIEGVVTANSIVFAGTICEKKGIRQLIQAFPLVKEKFPKVTLEIYGRDWFFPDGTSYIDMLRKSELPQLGKSSDFIRFNGVIDYLEIPKKYSQAEVCVFPSHMETQGLVAPEAMAMQKVVVFTNQGPGPETIKEFETGLLCNPYSPEDIAEKIIWVFSNNELSKEIGINAREFVLQKFSLDRIVKQNIGFYEGICNQ